MSQALEGLIPSEFAQALTDRCDARFKSAGFLDNRQCPRYRRVLNHQTKKFRHRDIGSARTKKGQGGA